MAQEPSPIKTTPTTVRLLTSLAPGAIAVVQLAGPDAKSIAYKLFRERRRGAATADDGRSDASARFRHVDFVGPDGTAYDDGLVVRITDELVELNVHGGIRIVQRLIQQARAAGALPAPDSPTPNPETRNPKPETQDQAVVPRDPAFDWLAPLDRWAQACLPHAATAKVVRWLLAQPPLWTAQLTDWRARVTRGDMASVGAELQAVLDASRLAGRAWRGRTLAILGAPNAGKSTLANRLAGRNLSLVSDTPGTTRDWVDQPIALAGWPVTLIDTAGLRTSSDPIEAEGVARALDQARRADARLWLIDASTPADASDPTNLLLTAQNRLKSGDVLAYSKSDLPRRRARHTEQGRQPATVPVLEVSAHTGQNWSVLEDLILKALGLSALQERKPLVFCAELQLRIEDLALALMSGRADRALAVLDSLLPRDFDARPDSGSSEKANDNRGRER